MLQEKKLSPWASSCLWCLVPPMLVAPAGRWHIAQFGAAKAQLGAGAILALLLCGGGTPVTTFGKCELNLWQARALVARTAAWLLMHITPLCHMDAAVNTYSTRLLYGDSQALQS